MSLNYGLGGNFSSGGTGSVPVMSGVCIFAAINHNMQQQYPNPPNHSKPYLPISIISAGSVVHIMNHSFKKALPEVRDNGVIEYFITTLDSVSGTATDTKIVEYRPKLAKGSEYSYDVNMKVRVGDYITQSKIDGSSAFMFSVRRKADNGKPSIGFGGNTMTYTIFSPR